jgi:hypothetical protein
MDKPLQRRLKPKARGPGEVSASAAGIESEVPGLVWAVIFIEHPGCSVPPEAGHAFSNPGDRLCVVLARAEVIRGGEAS